MVETARRTEILNSFAEASLLVPVTMRLVLREKVEEMMMAWGNDFHWINVMLGWMGVGGLMETEQVMEMIKAGRRGVWEIDGKNNFEAVITRVVSKAKTNSEIEYRRMYLTGLAMKATVLAMVGGEREKYKEQLVFLRAMQAESDYFDELLGQLGMNLSKEKRGRLIELLKKIDLG